MGYNHGRALKVFKNEWEEKEKIYRGLGMTEEQIQKIYDLDYSVFCSDRCFYYLIISVRLDINCNATIPVSVHSEFNIKGFIFVLIKVK